MEGLLSQGGWQTGSSDELTTVFTHSTYPFQDWITTAVAIFRSCILLWTPACFPNAAFCIYNTTQNTGFNLFCCCCFYFPGWWCCHSLGRVQVEDLFVTLQKPFFPKLWILLKTFLRIEQERQKGEYIGWFLELGRQSRHRNHVQKTMRVDIGMENIERVKKNI